MIWCSACWRVEGLDRLSRGGGLVLDGIGRLWYFFVSSLERHRPALGPRRHRLMSTTIQEKILIPSTSSNSLLFWLLSSSSCRGRFCGDLLPLSAIATFSSLNLIDQSINSRRIFEICGADPVSRVNLCQKGSKPVINQSHAHPSLKRPASQVSRQVTKEDRIEWPPDQAHLHSQTNRSSLLSPVSSTST